MSEAVSSSSRPSSTDLQLGLGAFAVAALVVIVLNTDVPAGENGGTGPMIVSLVLLAVVAAALFLYVLPRTQNATRTAVILTVLSVLTMLPFWFALPVLFGTAAFLVGRRAGGAAGMTAQVVGPLTAVVVVAGALFG